MSGTGPGQGVTGFIATADNPFDPVSAGYPPSNPSAGFTPKDEGFAGVIHGAPTDGSATLSLYCIDILTVTYGGIGYGLGTWDASNVPNVGYVARILNENFPSVPTAPPGLANDNQRAAATQAAIWFFSDRYVLNTSDPLHNAVAALVTAVIAAGPLDQAPPPTLTISPTTAGGPEGTPVGPFTVTSTTPTATVTATGGSMFADAAASQPIADGATVASGTNIWLTASGTDSAVLQATAVATVPTGNVYLYDGNTPGVTDAQKLILAQSATLRTTVRAIARFQAPGSLVVTKAIAGAAAGQQGPIVITVTCNGTVLQPLFVIPAGTPASSQSHTYTDIPAGSTCRVVETLDGHTADVIVRKPRSGTVVTIPPGGTAKADLTDTYDTGALVVNKTITGTAAGQQTAVTITVTCDGTALADFVIPAGTPAGTVSQTYDRIVAGSVCTVTETADGGSSTVTVTSEGSPVQVTIAPNGSGTADLTDTYDLVPGSLVVTKTLAGPAAGQQGRVAILVSCGGPPNVFAFLIDAGTPGGPVPRTYEDIPAGSTCLVAEVVNGGTDTVAVEAAGSPQRVTVPVGGTATANLTDTFAVIPTSTTSTTTPAILPATGGGIDATTLVLGGIAALVAGATLILVARRRDVSQDG